jgi:hypothetical protein
MNHRPAPLHLSARAAQLARFLLAATTALAVVGCGAAPAPVRPDMRTLDERRAVLVIQEALQDNGAKPGPAKEVTTAAGKPLRVEATVVGTNYGVAFITEQEAADLGAALPPRRDTDELRLIRPGQDIVLLLYQDRYQYDVADTHSATAVAAENELRKDIGDFVQRVVKAGPTR